MRTALAGHRTRPGAGSVAGVHEPVTWRRPGWVATLVFLGVAAFCCAGLTTLSLMGLSQFGRPSQDTSGPARDGMFEFSVGSARCGVHSVGEGWVRDRPQGQFCVIELTVTNIGNRAQRFADGAQKAYGPNGELYEADTGAGVAANGSGDAIWNVVNPGNSLTVKVVFDIPPSASLTRIELHDSPLSRGATVDLPGVGGA